MLNREFVKKLMRARKITSGRLAACVGVSESMMSYILSGLRDPSMLTLIRMANELECTLDEMVIR